MFVGSPRWLNYPCLPAADAYGLSHYGGFYLRFSPAADRFAISILLSCERLSFKRRNTVYRRPEGQLLKL